jgi:hypothetical protein
LPPLSEYLTDATVKDPCKDERGRAQSGRGFVALRFLRFFAAGSPLFPLLVWLPRFSHLRIHELGICFGFRISDFGFLSIFGVGCGFAAPSLGVSALKSRMNFGVRRHAPPDLP